MKAALCPHLEEKWDIKEVNNKNTEQIFVDPLLVPLIFHFLNFCDPRPGALVLDASCYMIKH